MQRYIRPWLKHLFPVKGVHCLQCWAPGLVGFLLFCLQHHPPRAQVHQVLEQGRVPSKVMQASASIALLLQEKGDALRFRLWWG